MAEAIGPRKNAFMRAMVSRGVTSQVASVKANLGLGLWPHGWSTSPWKLKRVGEESSPGFLYCRGGEMSVCEDARRRPVLSLELVRGWGMSMWFRDSNGSSQ